MTSFPAAQNLTSTPHPNFSSGAKYAAGKHFHTMPGDSCIVCGNSRKKLPGLKYHRFPSDPSRLALWLQVFSIAPEKIKSYHRVCSRHFKDGNPDNAPDLTIGKKFASPVKKGDSRTRRAQQRQKAKDLANILSSLPSPSSAALPQSKTAAVVTATVPEDVTVQVSGR